MARHLAGVPMTVLLPRSSWTAARSRLPVDLAVTGFTAIPASQGAIAWTEDDGDEVLLAPAVAAPEVLLQFD